MAMRGRSMWMRFLEHGKADPICPLVRKPAFAKTGDMELSDQRQQGTVRETLTMTALTSRLAWAASFALAASFGAAQAQQTSITVGLQLEPPHLDPTTPRGARLRW